MNSLSSASVGLRPVFGRLLSQPTRSWCPRTRWMASTDSQVTENGSPSPMSPVVDRGQRHEVGVGDRGEVDDARLHEEPVRVGPAQVDQVDPAEQRGGARAGVALDDDDAMAAEGPHVGHQVGRDLGPVVQLAAGERLAPDAELVDVAPGLVRVGHRGALEGGVQEPAVPADRHGLEAAAVRLGGGRAGQGGLFGDMDCRAPRTAGRGAGLPRRSAGSTGRTRRRPRGRRRRPRCSDSGSMSPPVSRRSLVPSFTIGKPSRWSGSRNEMKSPTSTGARPAAGGLEVRPEVVGADQEVHRVGLAAEAVVRHGEELARGCVRRRSPRTPRPAARAAGT